MDIIITKANQSDWPYIKEKLQKYALDAAGAEWHNFFVANIGIKIKGFGRIINREDYIEIASLGVDYYYRRNGVGKSLLAFLIKEASNTSPGKHRTEARNRNQHAMHASQSCSDSAVQHRLDRHKVDDIRSHLAEQLDKSPQCKKFA